MKVFSLVSYAALMLILTATTGCQKDNTYQDYATLTGFDRRACSCCGGLYMNLGNNPTTVISSSYIIKNSPSSLGIDSSTVFPIYLLVNWQKVSQDSCPQDITITKFQRP